MTKIPNCHTPLPHLMPDLSREVEMIESNGIYCIQRTGTWHV